MNSTPQHHKNIVNIVHCIEAEKRLKMELKTLTHTSVYVWGRNLKIMLGDEENWKF